MVGREGFDKEKLEDRVYRLHYNVSQNRTDRFAQVGALLGAAANSILRGPSTINIAAGTD